jgi:hypothetical protein
LFSGAPEGFDTGVDTEGIVPLGVCSAGWTAGVAMVGVTNTAVAVSVSLDFEPTAPTCSPTQTLAKVGALTPCSENVVVVLTSTVSVVLWRAFRVNAPAVSAAPQVPAVVLPFTDATVPNTA